MSHEGAGRRSVMRSVAFLTTGVLAVPALAACSSEEKEAPPTARQDLGSASRAKLADGATARWAVDALPKTLNAYQSDADEATSRVAGAVLPSMFRLDAQGRPARDADFLESAKVVETDPQVVLYKLDQRAVWSDGREIGAADFVAQWHALSGKNSAYWTARNAGYNRIAKIERGDNDLQVRVTFKKKYADWRSLFSPLYPKQVMGSPDAFNEDARKALKITAGPFAPEQRKKGAKASEDRLTLVRNPRWWGERAKLDKLVLRAVPAARRLDALRKGEIDIAALEPGDARRISGAAEGQAAGGAPAAGPGAARGPAQALRSWAVVHGSDEQAADKEKEVRAKAERARQAFAEEQQGLGRYEIRKSLEPAFTQLALNGASGPLTDDRVRRAVARAIDRGRIARSVLGPLGLPAKPVGSHLALAGQLGYADGSGALGAQDTDEAQALLADAGWVPGGPLRKGGKKDEETDARADTGTEKGTKDTKKSEAEAPGSDGGDEGKKTARPSGEAGAPDDGKAAQDKPHSQPGGAPGAYAPKGTAAPGGSTAGLLAKDGKALTLRFVLPSGPGSRSLREVGADISKMLGRIGIRTQLVKVADEDYFKDHIAAGEYDMALYSWPATAFPATDARPIYAKPVPAADGSLNVEQNYTRVGTDYIDQLFDKATTELDSGDVAGLMRKADARIWAAAGSLPLYQRPQLVAVRKDLANVGAYGFESPRYEDIGFLKSAGHGGPAAHRGTPGAGEPGKDQDRAKEDESAGSGKEKAADKEKATGGEKDSGRESGKPSAEPSAEEKGGTGPDKKSGKPSAEESPKASDKESGAADGRESDKE
ncbi:ABC transporter substrate-binding protein [Streptomyces physcomitrii]|uniref:ABC transporter family substrate-binding protein n=1 Tax=Streptomyces physcomitrii TaxID=2724184 RepID=A0ABX1GW23_9ACTN|nr:ABC transporter substrate-binding protein [Streptomyces physcomitrii]NKI39948.1 ABC transporter family substrate-binding protein [Streptomyces physcomitrii]